MQAANLTAGQLVKLTPFGFDLTFTVVSTKMSNRTGYIDVTLKEASNVIRVPYSKQLDYWGDIPILC